MTFYFITSIRYFYPMKLLSVILLAIIVCASVSSCKKETYTTSKMASVYLSVDTLYFDTVFTKVGSITQYFKIFNNNNQKLLLNNVQLMGGVNSYFKLNLDGAQGTVFNNQTIEANVSLYGFVTVTINPNDSIKPFVIKDSIRIIYNGDTTFLQLRASGQNANRLNNVTITHDTTWTNNLPIVISGGVTINSGATLTITQGTKIYLNQHAPIIVNGTLNAQGSNDSSGAITFLCDRLDVPYSTLPGSWPGIYFTASSVNNLLQYCTIANSNEGVDVQSYATNGTTKLILNQCIFNNVKDVAIKGNNTSIVANNCLVSNCGYNVLLYSGGHYIFDQCTIASYDNSFVSHVNPVLTISNSDSNNKAYPLSCTFINSILYGGTGFVSDEVVATQNTGATFDVTFNNVLYRKTNTLNKAVVQNNCLVNMSPMFKRTTTDSSSFNFHLTAGSPCIGAGMTSLTLINDLEGYPLSAPPTLGCYQRLQ